MGAERTTSKSEPPTATCALSAGGGAEPISARHAGTFPIRALQTVSFRTLYNYNHRQKKGRVGSECSESRRLSSAIPISSILIIPEGVVAAHHCHRRTSLIWRGSKHAIYDAWTSPLTALPLACIFLVVPMALSRSSVLEQLVISVGITIHTKRQSNRICTYACFHT